MLQAFPLYYILNMSGPRRDRRGNAERPIYHDHRLAVAPVARASFKMAGASLFLALRSLEVVRRAGIGPEQVAKLLEGLS